MPGINFCAYDGLLVDAFGVLYNHLGAFPESVACVQAMLDAGKPVVVVTNNTSVSPDTISMRLHAMGMPIDPKCIISSGRGLAWDPDARRLVDGKSVFLVGSDDAFCYVHDAGGERVLDVAQAQAVVLACTSDQADGYAGVIQHKRMRPDVPIICINPDRYVQANAQRVPVIGHFSEQIERQVGPIHWMGKPLPVFSTVVQAYCQTVLGLSLGANWAFVDDNPDNVHQMTQDLGVHGFVPVKTGLAQSWPTALPQSNAWRYIQRLSIDPDVWYNDPS